MLRHAKDRPSIDTVTWREIPIQLEFVKGQERHEGQPLTMHYGYFPDSGTDEDGDHLDVFVAEEHLASDLAVIINQRKETGGFDEHKVIIGCATESDARRQYLSNYRAGFRGLMSSVPVTHYQLRWFIDHGDLTRPVEQGDFLPGARAKKTAFCPDLLPADLERLPLPPGDPWRNWYQGYAQGAKTAADTHWQQQWQQAYAQLVPRFQAEPTAALARELQKKAIDPFRYLRGPARDALRAQLAQLPPPADPWGSWRKAAEAAGRAPLVCVDVDGTLARAQERHLPERIEDPRPGMVRFMQSLHHLGVFLIIHTVRGNRALLRSWLDQHAIPFDAINESPHQPPDSSEKVYADLYVDDRGVHAEGRDGTELLGEVLRRLRRSGYLQGKKPPGSA